MDTSFKEHKWLFAFSFKSLIPKSPFINFLTSCIIHTLLLCLNHGVNIIHTHFVLIVPSFVNISSMSKLKAKKKRLQKCGTSHKRSHNFVTCVTDGLYRVTLTNWQSLYGPTGSRESSRLMRIDPLLVVLSFHISLHHWFFLIKFTASVNFLCFNYRSFQSVCGDFHSSICSHTTSSN